MHDPASRRHPDEQLGGFKEVKSAKIPTLNTLSILNSDKIKPPCLRIVCVFILLKSSYQGQNGGGP